MEYDTKKNMENDDFNLKHEISNFKAGIKFERKCASINHVFILENFL